MGAPISDEQYKKYAPKWFREQSPRSRDEPPSVPAAPTAPLSTDVHEGWRARSKFTLWSRPEPSPPPPQQLEHGTLTLIGGTAWVVSFAALGALLVLFAEPLWQGASGFLNKDSQIWQTFKPTQQASKQSDRLTGKNATANSTGVLSAKIAAGSGAASANAPAQRASLGQEPSVRTAVRGLTESEIRFGISAPFSGAAKELGQNMKIGIEAAFNAVNANGGVHGRQLRLIAADDGYEPVRTAETMKQLYEKDRIFGLVGNVGTPTAAVALPYALDRKMLFFGAFTGAGLLRSDPPDRYVFNYRASYAEETSAVVHYLVKVKRLRPNQIAVFAQQDSYGDAGFSGVTKAVRALGGDEKAILRLHYQRNTVDVDGAVDQLKKSRNPIKAVIMVPTYRAAAKFIEKTRDLFPGMIYTSVSFVGSTALANELMQLGKGFATGVIVTQVVPALKGHSSLVLDYKAALAKYFPGEAPDYVSLEGYVAANVLITALRRNGPDLDTEKLVQTFENLRDLDIGLGTPVSFGRSEHQGVHKVWGTQLDENARYQPIDLQ
jgi:ABC-type branched-subunit amino acid transport system substrate-binding protein